MDPVNDISQSLTLSELISQSNAYICADYVLLQLTDTLWKVLNTSRSTGMHGHLQCRFRRPKVATGGRSTIFELERDNQYHIFLAKGDATPNGTELEHLLCFATCFCCFYLRIITQMSLYRC